MDKRGSVPLIWYSQFILKMTSGISTVRYSEVENIADHSTNCSRSLSGSAEFDREKE